MVTVTNGNRVNDRNAAFILASASSYFLVLTHCRPLPFPPAAARKSSDAHEGDEQNLRRTKCADRDRKSTRLNSSHVAISYAVFCLKKKKAITPPAPWVDVCPSPHQTPTPS